MTDYKPQPGIDLDDVGVVARAAARAWYKDEEIAWVDLTAEQRKKFVAVAEAALETRKDIAGRVICAVGDMLSGFTNDAANVVQRLKSVNPFQDKAEALDAILLTANERWREAERLISRAIRCSHD